MDLSLKLIDQIFVINRLKIFQLYDSVIQQCWSFLLSFKKCECAALTECCVDIVAVCVKFD